MYTPRRAIETPERKKMGVKRTDPPRSVNIPTNISTTLESDMVKEPSTVEMSWVHRVRIRDVGVSSSQLNKVCQYETLDTVNLTDRRVEPNTESTSFALIDPDARRVLRW
jgi:hypothetical protein